MRQSKLKSVCLPTPADLSEQSLIYALDILRADAWADIVVHPSELRYAIKVARLHNEKKPAVQVRVLTDKMLALQDWRLRSATAEVRSS